METKVKELTPYQRLFTALCEAGAGRIAETKGWNKGQTLSLWAIPGRKQPVIIHRYDDGGWQDYHPGQIHETDPAIAAILQKDPPAKPTYDELVEALRFLGGFPYAGGRTFSEAPEVKAIFESLKSLP